MIPTIIFFFLRHYRKRNPREAERLQYLLTRVFRCIFLVVAGTAIAAIAQAQEKKLEYHIKRNGNVVGNIRFTQNITGNRTILKMESEVKTRFIFLFTAKASEESIYENGIMTWSSIYRKLNGNEKANKKTKMTGNSYTIYKGDKSEILNSYPIRYNMLSIYAAEPLQVSKVYSDNFQQMIDIQKMADHHYKIKFPDGNYNEYFYANGICSKVIVHHSLYSAVIELKS